MGPFICLSYCNELKNNYLCAPNKHITKTIIQINEKFNI